jgi:UDPglucose 6-dehydrogenase
MKITVIGTGYVGLVSGVCFSEIGNDVLCVDINEEKVNQMKQGRSPIYEPGLEELMKKNIANNRLNFTSSLKDGVQFGDMIFIAVGTPPTENGGADLSFVEAAAKDIGKYMNGYKVVVTKSTVPVGTNRKVKEWITSSLSQTVDFDVASNPEFLREGSAIEDTLNMNRAVVGVESSKALEMLRELHKPFNTVLVETDIETAEMIKYASNAFLATKISFINEIANLCEYFGADVTKVSEGMGLDPRIGNKFLQAGLGYGGSCFPKDTKALINIAKEVGYDIRLVPEVENVNYRQRSIFVNKVVNSLDKDIANKKIGVLGLSFKPNTDDMRDAPSIDIIKALNEKGAMITAYDPIASRNAQQLIEDLKVADSIEEVFTNADAVLLITDWKEFKSLDLGELGSLMKSKILIDGRNIYNPIEVEKLGYTYITMGRASREEIN